MAVTDARDPFDAERLGTSRDSRGEMLSRCLRLAGLLVWRELILLVMLLAPCWRRVDRAA